MRGSAKMPQLDGKEPKLPPAGSSFRVLAFSLAVPNAPQHFYPWYQSEFKTSF